MLHPERRAARAHLEQLERPPQDVALVERALERKVLELDAVLEVVVRLGLALELGELDEVNLEVREEALEDGEVASGTCRSSTSQRTKKDCNERASERGRTAWIRRVERAVVDEVLGPPLGLDEPLPLVLVRVGPRAVLVVVVRARVERLEDPGLDVRVRRARVLPVLGLRERLEESADEGDTAAREARVVVARDGCEGEGLGEGRGAGGEAGNEVGRRGCGRVEDEVRGRAVGRVRLRLDLELLLRRVCESGGAWVRGEEREGRTRARSATSVLHSTSHRLISCSSHSSSTSSVGAPGLLPSCSSSTLQLTTTCDPAADRRRAHSPLSNRREPSVMAVALS